MMITRTLSFTLALVALAAGGQGAQDFDVIVVGATSAGVGAAIAAGRQGMKVALVEETPTLGGLLANGLSNTDLRSPGGSSGIFEEFRLRSKKYYTENFPQDPAMQKVRFAREGFRYEPHVADRIFKQMVAEIPSIRVYYGRIPTRVLKSGKRVTGVVTTDLQGAAEITFRAPVTIDATHEGDLLPLAGAQFRLGREPRSREEPHAGKIYMTWSGEMFGPGTGDDKLQAYAMLLTIKDYGPGADKTIPQPPNYDSRNYVPEKLSDTWWHTGGVLPNLKYEVNENLDGTDAADFNRGYINGGRDERRRAWEKYRDHALGYLYFRQTVMGEKSMGLCEDEYPENGHLPYILYVREGRRLEGVYMFGERDAIRVPGFLRPPLQKESIAVGDWEIDSHAVARDTEGYVFLSSTADKFRVSAPYQAPYGIMVPKEVDGLLVPMAVSATHIGFQVLRLEAIRVSMGQAAGNAAALCVKKKIQPREVPVAELQQMLLEQGNALFYYTDVPPANPHFRAIQRLSQAGMIEGFDNFSFQPRQVPVAELQELLLEQGNALFYYTDVPPANPHFRAIQRLSQAGVIEGFDNFSFQPDRPASKGDLAKLLFLGLGLQVKMDYSDLWKVMRWNRRSQYCTPDHWATYYLMTLYNMHAFGDNVLATLNPDDPATREEVARWSAVALGRQPPAGASVAGTITRGELCSLIDRLRSVSKAR